MKISEMIKLFCEDYCDEELEFRDDYSGRCMYGKTCVGIVCDNPANVLVSLTEYLVGNDICDILNELGSICQDSMGMRTIIYFKGVQ